MTVSLNTTSGTAQCLERQDFATTSFVCDVGGLLEPTVRKTTSLLGNGSTANPLAVRISSDLNNQVVFGADGGVFVNAAPVLGVATTACIDLTLTALGTLSANPIISGTIFGRNNSLTCSPTGMFAPEAQFSTLNTCIEGGIGPDFMLREVTDIGNNQFRIGGAPEHTAVFSQGIATRTEVNLPPPQSIINYLGMSLSITNPSNCREMVVIERLQQNEFAVLCRGFPNPGTFSNRWRMLKSTNAGPFVGHNSNNFRTRIDNFGNPGVGVRADFEVQGQSFDFIHVLAPSAVLTIAYRVDIILEGNYNILDVTTYFEGYLIGITR